MLVISGKGQWDFDKKVHVGAGITFGVPVGVFRSVYSFTLGGTVKAQLALSQKFLLTADAGYYGFLRKGGGEGVGFIPFLGGFEYHFEPKVFIDLQAGIGVPTVSNNGTALCFVTGLGYSISKKMQVTGNFIGFGKYGYVIGNIGVELVYYF
ncbi:MAG: hypothetical protein ABI416_10515 [Ginsengibacter sp.]